MTPPAAAQAARTRTRRTAPPPRRVSGPVRSRSGATTTAPPPLGLRLGGAVQGLADHRWLDRVIRGRAWIAILGLGLIGIVFMQVSMLRMNAGIGRAVDTAATLERENAAYRATISELSSGDHIAAEAVKLGFVAPTQTPRFLDARGFDPARALRVISAPGVGVLATTTTPSSTTDTTVGQLAQTGVAPSPSTIAAAPPVTAAPASTTTTTPSSTTPPASSTTTTPTGTATTTTPQTTQPTQTTAPPATGGAAATGGAG
jgi:hypothetical protein